MPLLAVRVADLSDADALRQLFIQLGYPSQQPDLAGRLLNRVDHNFCEAFVATRDGLVQGAIVVNTLLPIHETGSWAVISALIVDEQHRNSGTGARLLAAAESYALQSGCTQIELASNVNRTDAHRFYESHGYFEKRKRFLKLLSLPKIGEQA